LVGSFNISLNCGEERSDWNCCIDCASCSGEGGWDKSGMPGMLSRPARREDISGGEVGESDPPRGMDVVAAHNDEIGNDVVGLLMAAIDLRLGGLLDFLASEDANVRSCNR